VLRRNETEAERRLWNLLRNRNIRGLKFVRQHAIGPYFADFVCRDHMLIVEVDGSQHAGSESDVVRTAFLNARGYHVLRFWNNEVLAELDGVAAMLAAAIDGALTGPSPAWRFSPATLSPEGRGESTDSARND
jgi:very-short-patch-repair endonuclease